MEMIRDGTTPRECGAILGRTKLACELRAYHLFRSTPGVPTVRKLGRPVDHEREEAVIDLFVADPTSILEAARRLGKSYTTVRVTVNRLVKMGVLKPNYTHKKKGRRYRVCAWWVRKVREDGDTAIGELAACVVRGRAV